MEEPDGNRRVSFLPNPPQGFRVSKELSGAILNLNFDDRLAIEEEIHGVRCGAVEETPELLERSLFEFDEQLNTIKEEDPDKALLRNVTRVSSHNPTVTECYLNDPDIRLRFLRCECFAVDKAVRRLISFLEFTSDLFGDYVAERPIQLSDFNTKDEELALQNSRNQFLPFRDRSGRRILAGVGSCDFHLDYRLRYKILMYMHWVASEDVESQRKGIVIVAWLFDEDGEQNIWETKIRPRLRKRVRSYHQKQNNSLPLREAGIHHCVLDTPMFHVLSSMYVFGLDPHHRTLYKKHVGGNTELLYSLSSYGIPHDLIPISSTGKVKTATQSSWVNGQRVKMRNNDDKEIVDCPRSLDVVFKQGPAYKNNPGNMYFRELIQMYSDEHLQGSKDEKYRITLSILQEVENRNGRFLEWSKAEGVWVVGKDRNKVRVKIAASLKQYNRQRKESQQLKTTIENAASLVADNISTASTLTSHERSKQDENLKRYYSSEPVYFTKRQKTKTICSHGSNSSADEDTTVTDVDMTCGFDDSSCFGKAFYPT
mmetsp:Transcript_12545/g.26405  ORF Transcript_12545/g.26405 Transcript_12545/m.26405 type:complete len:541 (+) Transcript_12545:151-1773(+)|eukprot:CAMPEP_0168222278 /NCGR_PEP_ID=MMETSP0140_2-20121125/10511_1 /TAXON_ID=44445 /ORGANISM="Pseudo-nitzschia australis, Strain 10249 10 AB" /LENGTH=540 /DNA_ID=CAMNT_0008151721 /DNA_START=120 /DNA_END=1742 /DNA_ORIENTATION=-